MLNASIISLFIACFMLLGLYFFFKLLVVSTQEPGAYPSKPKKEKKKKAKKIKQKTPKAETPEIKQKTPVATSGTGSQQENALKMKINSVRSMIRDLENKYQSGNITREVYIDKKSYLMEKLGNLQGQLETLQS